MKPPLLALHRQAFDYFVNEADAKTGLVKDRAANFGRDSYAVASLASTGFGLAALAVGAERGYLSRAAALAQATRTLKFVASMPNQHGWLYHFVEKRTGARAWNCEVSTIDTALFLAGALAAGEYFKGTEAERLAQTLYRRVDFNWMRTDGGARPNELLLCHGWTPEKGFLASRWDAYSEHVLLNLLALSSPTHPVPVGCWTAWKRDTATLGPYRAWGIRLPLFTHQYLHAFANLRGRKDAAGEDFWANSVAATKANRWYCIQRAEDFAGWGADGWGVSAVDGPDGYRAYAPTAGDSDGTLSPMALAAALPFLPKEAATALLAMNQADSRQPHANQLRGRYGFSAVNETRRWRGPEMVGIDAGAALLLLDRALFAGDFTPSLVEKAGIARGLKRIGFLHHE